MEADFERAMTHEPLSIHFRLLYNWAQGIDQDSLLQHKVSMYAAFEVTLNHTRIYRLIDATLASTTMTLNQVEQQYHYQHQHQHWISAGQLWKACGLTLIEGLFLFELASSQYHLDFLQPSFPYTDIWVPLGLARSMATTLGVIEDLAWFLNEPTLGRVTSSDDADRQEMVHNWRIIGIPNTSYSTRALLDYTLVAGELLSMNDDDDEQQQQQQTTTLMTRHQYQPGIVMKDRAETGLVRWQVWAYEHFLTTQRDQPSLLFGDAETHIQSGVGDDAGRGSRASIWSSDSIRRRRNNKRYSGSPIHGKEEGDDEDDPVPVAAFWDVVQGLLCDLQSLERRQQHDDIATLQDECKPLKASRVFSDSMVIGNMPLKSTFLRQSPALQHIYLSVMMEKLYNAMDELSVTTMKQRKHDLDMPFSSTQAPAPPILPQQQQQQQQQLKGPTATSTTTSISTTTQSERTNTSKSYPHHQQQRQRPRSFAPRHNNNNHLTTMATPATTSQMDPNMMLHDRMDLLEQEMYRVKKKAKRKMDESDLKWMELQHQLMTLDTWKRNLESRRKNERAWMLLIILLLSLVFWVFS